MIFLDWNRCKICGFMGFYIEFGKKSLCVEIVCILDFCVEINIEYVSKYIYYNMILGYFNF